MAADLYARVAGGGRFWLATADGRTIGLLAAEERRDPWEAPGEELWIVDLYVVPEARRRGAAAALIDAAAASAGSRRLVLGVLPENAAARALYAKLGFAPVMLRLARPALG